MERITALLAGTAVVALIYGGFVAIRTISRFLRATVWFAETVGLLAFALVIGYVAYRVLWGTTDDPRMH